MSPQRVRRRRRRLAHLTSGLAALVLAAGALSACSSASRGPAEDATTAPPPPVSANGHGPEMDRPPTAAPHGPPRDGPPRDGPTGGGPGATPPPAANGDPFDISPGAGPPAAGRPPRVIRPRPGARATAAPSVRAGSAPMAGAAPAPRAGVTAATGAPPAAPNGVTTSLGGQTQWYPYIYNRPPTLRFKEPEQVQFIINVLGQPAIEEEFRDLSGPVRSGQIRVSRRMEARLTGPPDQVTITPSDPNQKDVQTVTDIANPSWKWDVVAKRPGRALLTLNVYAHVQSGDSPEPVRVLLKSEPIPVRTDLVDTIQWWIGRINPIWVWIVGVFTTLGGALVWWRKNMAKKPS